MGKDRQIMDEKELQAIAPAAAKEIKTEADLVISLPTRGAVV
tara:strand:- start:740 stop:865 length:126 start_codon:yes stop_codon:yes gene_type:complete